VRITPQPKIKNLWRSKKRYKVAYGGRGSGKSYGVAQRFMVFALQMPDARILCTKETQNSLSDSALAILKRVIHDSDLDCMFQPTKHGLKCINGAEFIFRGLQHPDRIKSLDGISHCWVEEGQKISQEAWDILIPTIREDGSEIWVTFNPDLEDDPAFNNFVLNTRDDVEIELINYQDNPKFPEVLKNEMEYDKANDYDKYLHVWEGHCRTYSDAQVFFGKWRVENYDTPKDVNYYFGADWGFSQDPTTLVRCYIKDRCLYIDREAYGIGVDIDKTPELFNVVPEAVKWPITADSARPETISYMQRHGYPKMRSAKKGAGSIEDGIAFLRSFKEIVVHERCKHVADEMKLYSYKTDKLTGEITPNIEDKHNHMIDALRYAVEMIMRQAKVPTISVPFRR